MPAHHPSGLGGLLDPDDALVFSSAVSDHCHGQTSANMFNASGECQDDEIIAACKGFVFLQCWPHLSRAVRSMLTADCGMRIAH